MGIVSKRMRRMRARRAARSLTIVMLVLLMGIAAASAGPGRWISGLMAKSAAAFSIGESAQAELTLPSRSLYALQLGVFDSGQRAEDEVRRLRGLGMPCVVWQKEKLRLIADASFDREKLRMPEEAGVDAYVIEETLPEVTLRISAAADSIDDVSVLLQLPDDVLIALMDGESLEEICPRVRQLAEAALSTQTEHPLYNQLAESLIRWCSMMENPDMGDACGYGAAAMAALCRELRQALMASSTASAQRTPSTAAEVMPPA